MDPSELRTQNFIRTEQFPHQTTTGLDVRLGRLRQDACASALDIAGYEDLRKEQARQAASGALMGIGISVLHRGAWARAAQAHRHPRALDVRRRDLRVHPSGKAIASVDRRADAGAGARDHVRADRGRRARASRREDVEVAEGDTDNTPYGLGTYGSPLHAREPARAVAVVVPQAARQGAQDRGAPCSRPGQEDLEWEEGRWYVEGRPTVGAAIHEIAQWPRTPTTAARAWRPAWRRRSIYDPPNLTYPVRRLHRGGGGGPGAPRSRDGAGAWWPWTTAACASTR